VTRSGQYWAFAHYSKHIKRGARVFASGGLGYDGAGGAVSHTAFRNPDGSTVVTLANTGEQPRAQLVIGSKMLEVDLPAQSVSTLHWM
jgi:glucosylceramidase